MCEEDKIDPLKSDKAEFYLSGLRLALELESISCVLLQRKLSISYPFAYKILEWLIEKGYVKKGLKKDYVKTSLIKEIFINIRR